jgi:hypothetical protein
MEEDAKQLGLTEREKPEDVWFYCEPGKECVTYTEIDF